MGWSAAAGEHEFNSKNYKFLGALCVKHFAWSGQVNIYESVTEKHS